MTSRGNERPDLFRDDGDRKQFLAILGRTASIFRWRLYAYVLMGYQYHLVLERPDPTLSRETRQLNGIYIQAFNRGHRRTGHLSQGRLKAIFVEKEAHLLELCRYVAVNPVRAKLVRRAKDWRWSSYRATAGLEKAPQSLDTDWTLEQFGRTRAKAVPASRRFAAEGVAGAYEPWEALQGQIYLGSEAFRKEALRRISGRPNGREVSRAQRRSAPVPKDASWAKCLETFRCGGESLTSRTRLLSTERKAVALILRRQGLLRLAEIGEFLGVREGQASRLVAEGETVLRENAKFKRRLESLTDDLAK